MENKKTVLIRVAYLVELSEEEVNPDDGVLDRLTSIIGEDKNLVVNQKEIKLEWNSTSSLILEPDELNCGKCSNCGQWVTDKEKPDVILELCNGTTVDGKLLCDDCLPPDHRWAF